MFAGGGGGGGKGKKLPLIFAEEGLKPSVVENGRCSDYQVEHGSACQNSILRSRKSYKLEVEV